jgi:hypothetical protein
MNATYLVHRKGEEKMTTQTNKIKLKTTALILAAGIMAASAPPAYALDASGIFTDVPRDHWAWKNGTLPWAAQAGILNEKQTETFNPGEVITEAEFLTMMMRLFPDTRDKLGTGTTEEVYALAREYNLPAAGINDPAKRADALTRIQVARLFSAAGGHHYDDEGAIAYMYEHGITKGMDGESTIAGYGSSQKVSRVEAVQFLKMAHDTGIASTMQKMPEQPSYNPAVTRFISSSPETVVANLHKAQNAILPKRGQIRDYNAINFWAKRLYETFQKIEVTHDGTLRIYLPSLSEHQTLIYHVASDKWYSGEIAGNARSNVPAYLEFPASADWSVMLMAKDQGTIVGDMYYDTASQTIEINNIVIQKHVKK